MSLSERHPLCPAAVAAIEGDILTGDGVLAPHSKEDLECRGGTCPGPAKIGGYAVRLPFIGTRVFGGDTVCGLTTDTQATQVDRK